ncbi:MAG: hypothetical protein KGN32_09275 [Burkholderiales bacterium]|nr:hypothetical protein [Burkholderiales bacterium]
MMLNPFDIPLGWLLGAAVLVVLAWFGWVEYHAHLLKTHVTQDGGVLRFVAHGWSVEAHRGKEQLVVQARHGHYSHQRLDEEDLQVQEGAVEVKLPAPGLRIEVKPGAAQGTCVVMFHAADEIALAAQSKTGGQRSEVRVDRVPAPVAVQFSAFAGQLRVWVEKLEQRIAAQRKAELEALERQTADVAATPPESSKEKLTPDQQVAQWRRAAGFSGSSSEIGLNEKGGVLWFVDLDPTGRITLHSDGRTIHTTLAGASIASLGGELEVGVRDDYWSADEPELRRFRILKGLPPDERRAWKERMEILRDEMRAAAGPKL